LSTAGANPFVRDAGVTKPGIIGARWWNHALRTGSSLQGRRAALTGIAVVAGGAVLLGGLTIWAVSSAGSSSSSTEEEGREEMRASLQVQRDYGWNFGATSETVALDATYTKAYAREALPRLEQDLAPKSASFEPYYARALFQAPEALPKLTLPDGDTTRVKPLAEVLRPILTPEMEKAARIGGAYARIMKQAPERVFTIVDLAGRDSVAFAAGAAETLDPVFAFENWPHPRGVVAAHQTLAAAVYYQPVFAKARESRAGNAFAMFVLDRARLTPYTDNATQFDNRYWAKLPVDLKALGYTKVLYLVPTASDLPELDDLNGPFVHWKSSGVDVRALALSAFKTASDSATYDTRAPDEGAGFYVDYGWLEANAKAPAGTTPANNVASVSYRPAARAATHTQESIGIAPVIIGVGTGLLLGSRLNRSGSWNRASGGYGG
jgi:hypothetical protein